MDKAAAPKSQAAPLRQPLCAARLCPSALRFGLRRGELERGEAGRVVAWVDLVGTWKRHQSKSWQHACPLSPSNRDTHSNKRGGQLRMQLNSQLAAHTHTHTQEMLFQLILSSTPTLLPCKILMHFLPPPLPKWPLYPAPPSTLYPLNCYQPQQQQQQQQKSPFVSKPNSMRE